MYNLKRLSAVAYEGLSDLGPAVRQAFNADTSDDHMDLVYGSKPRLTVLMLGAACVILGEWFARAGPNLPLKEFVNWPAVLAGAVFAMLIRRYLFGQAKKPRPEDFDWLAASVVPAFGLVVLVSPLAGILFGFSSAHSFTDDPGVQLGTTLVILTNLLGLAAAMTIALATLCFSHNWPRALTGLATRLFIFKLMVWITALVLLELDIVSKVLGAVIEAVIGFRFPEWLAELADQISYAMILATAYLAVIGGTWMVCKRSFSQLLETGEVDVLAALETLAKDPLKTEKRALRKADKKARKAAKSQKTPS